MNKETITRVVKAWEIQGSNLWFHRKKKEALRVEWPTLAKTLDRLSEEYYDED